jgi:hypothetical protein
LGGRPTPVDPDFRVISRPDDWSMLQGRHPNVLVTGPRAATRAFIVAITPSLRSPIRLLDCTGRLDLPTESGTIVLKDVDALSRHEQERLTQWLDTAQPPAWQMIALTTIPLYHRVQTGAFLDALYYRLNIVHLEVSQA